MGRAQSEPRALCLGKLICRGDSGGWVHWLRAVGLQLGSAHGTD